MSDDTVLLWGSSSSSSSASWACFMFYLRCLVSTSRPGAASSQCGLYQLIDSKGVRAPEIAVVTAVSAPLSEELSLQGWLGSLQWGYQWSQRCKFGAVQASPCHGQGVSTRRPGPTQPLPESSWGGWSAAAGSRASRSVRIHCPWVCGREPRSTFLAFLTVELQVEGPVCPVSWLSGSDASSPLFQRVVWSWTLLLNNAAESLAS